MYIKSSQSEAGEKLHKSAISFSNCYADDIFSIRFVVLLFVWSAVAHPRELAISDRMTRNCYFLNAAFASVYYDVVLFMRAARQVKP